MAGSEYARNVNEIPAAGEHGLIARRIGLVAERDDRVLGAHCRATFMGIESVPVETFAWSKSCDLILVQVAYIGHLIRHLIIEKNFWAQRSCVPEHTSLP